MRDKFIRNPQNSFVFVSLIVFDLSYNRGKKAMEIVSKFFFCVTTILLQAIMREKRRRTALMRYRTNRERSRYLQNYGKKGNY